MARGNMFTAEHSLAFDGNGASRNVPQAHSRLWLLLRRGDVVKYGFAKTDRMNIDPKAEKAERSSLKHWHACAFGNGVACRNASL